MKRFLALALLLLTAGTVRAEEGILTANTVLRTSDSLVILKAGTVVQILARNDKTLSVRAGQKTGLIPWSAVETYSAADMMSAPRKPEPATTSASPSKPAAPVANNAAAPATATTPPEPRPAQTMYGKAVEKAAAAASSHEKAMVSPTDEILGGK